MPSSKSTKKKDVNKKLSSKSKSSNLKLAKRRLTKEDSLKSTELDYNYSTNYFRDSLALIIGGFALFLLLALSSYLGSSDQQYLDPALNIMGQFGYLISNLLFKSLGYCSFCIPVLFFLIARVTWKQGSNTPEFSISVFTFKLLFFSIFILSAATILSIFLSHRGGGVIGSLIALTLIEELNIGGTVLISLLFMLLSLSIILKLGIVHYLGFFNSIGKSAKLAAIDTGSVIKVGAKAGSNCLKKIPKLVLSDNDEFYLDDLNESFELETKNTKARKLKKAKRIKKKKTWLLGEEEDTEEIDDEIDLATDEDIEEDYLSINDNIEITTNEAPKILRGLSQTTTTNLKNSSKDKIIKSYNSKDYGDYQLPSRDLLVGVDTSLVDGPADDELLNNSKRLEQSLRNFKIGGRVVEVHPGPVVTLYQFEPAAGIKVQRIINLADDLALALKVESVRVYAPVPGKGTVGIEVPNEEREIVRLKDLIDSEDFQTKPFPLSLALGKDTYGQTFISDLSKMPHLLIAGATGTGKSVCINSLLMSLLYKNSPGDLRLILIDPKMLELSIYEKIPHLLSPVITNPKRARGVLYWAVEEMERRYNRMKELGVRDISMYNRMVNESDSKNNKTNIKLKKKDSIITLEEKDVVTTTAAEVLQRDSNTENHYANSMNDSYLEPLPRIVVVVDELADLMLTVGREIEELLTRLAQKARAAGIHLILATQRPSVNVITGLIKANFPARISFKVTSKIDARTIMDQSGAERLLGQGDMLFYSPAIGRVKRLHSPFVSDQEVHDVVSWIQTQGEPDYEPDIERVLNLMEEQENGNSNSPYQSDSEDSYDPLYDQAVQLVIEKGQASTSMVQRVFRIGYNRAARILETMEREGLVGPADGAKPRQVIGSEYQ